MMQSLHELERRAEVHRLEALKKIEAFSESSEQQELGTGASVDDGPTEPSSSAVAASHQHR